MPFAKGISKVAGSGRKKGQPNKINMLASQRLAELGCDPIAGMALIAKNSKNPIELRARMYAELAQYVQPKRRAIEVSGPGGEAVSHELNLGTSAAELLRSRIDSLVKPN